MTILTGVAIVLIAIFVLLIGSVLMYRYRTTLSKHISSTVGKVPSGGGVLKKILIACGAVAFFLFIFWLLFEDVFLELAGTEWGWKVAVMFIFIGIAMQFRTWVAIGLVLLTGVFVWHNYHSTETPVDPDAYAGSVIAPVSKQPVDLINRHFVEVSAGTAELAIKIAKEESGLRHYEPDGSIRLHENDLNDPDNVDVGLFQCNVKYWGGVARNMGINPLQHTPEENVLWALAIYKKAGGFEPWSTLETVLNRRESLPRDFPISFRAPGKGVWGDEVSLSSEVRSYVTERLKQAGKISSPPTTNDRRLIERIVSSFEIKRFTRYVVPPDEVWCRLDDGPAFRMGKTGRIPRFKDTIQIKTQQEEPYENEIWIYLPIVE